MRLGAIFTCLLTIVFCGIKCDCFSQNVIKGTVYDAALNEAVIGGSISIQGTTEGTITEWDGTFELSTLIDFPFTLVVSYIGYEDYILEILDDGKLNIKLTESSEVLEELVITGGRISEQTKKSPLSIESLDALAIKQTASNSFYEGLGNLKGVDLTTASLGFTVINTRGFNSTSPVRSLQIIDGVDNQSPGLNFSLGNFLGASDLDVQKVDLVVGASSAFYGPNAFNGVISMETKNPFLHSGLGVSLKSGERSLLQTQLRWADTFSNGNGDDWIGYKFNLSYFRANDWIADNYDPITGSEAGNIFTDPATNPGRSNGVNIYGDESFQQFSSLFDQNAGLNRFHRTGYEELDLVDYDTRNTKLGGAVHIRTQPSKTFESPEIIIASNFGTGTTVYQGDNRFSLRGIKFWQNRLEFRKKGKYFLRAYATNEDAGDSYDPYFTALRLQETANTNENYFNNYRRWWTGSNLGNIFNRMKDLGYPSEDIAAQQAWQLQFADSLNLWHSQAAAYADSGVGQNALGALPQPGTERFDSLFQDITSRKNNDIENGTRFFDQSALYHIHGEYTFDVDYFSDLRFGANGRLYRPNSEGTIFSDAIEKISNFEYGVYGGGSKKINNLTFSAALRMDKNQNFDALFSPAASLVWNPAENTFLRASFSSAIRNPTLSDQYLNLNVGPATLLGNIDGYENLATLESFEEFSRNPNNSLEFRDLDPIMPEKVKTFEVGYRTVLGGSLFLDGSYYYNIYDDFIGYQILLDIPFDTIMVTGLPDIIAPNLFGIDVFRISANSTETVTTQGLALGFNYYYDKYSLSGNYSWNVLNTKVEDDIVPAFNTPEHKYNISLGARELDFIGDKTSLGFNINYKWVDGFIFEGSPQFTGVIPSYDMLDAQVSFNLKNYYTTIKIGASNLLNNQQFQTYGGPRIGRMAYVSATYDFRKKLN